MMQIKISHTILPLVFGLLLSLPACQSHADETEDHHDNEEEMEGGVEEVGLTAIQMEKIGLEMGGFEMKNLRSTIKVNGQMELPPQNEAHVSSLVAGRVSQIFVKPGQEIRKGGRLARLENPEFIEWQQNYLEAMARMEFLDLELARQKELAEDEIAPRKQLEQVTSERKMVAARIKGVRAKLEMTGIPVPESVDADLVKEMIVVSPIAGFIKEIKINTGVFADARTELFEIVDNHHLHLDLRVFEKDLPSIRTGQTIFFSLQSDPGRVMEARIFAVGKALNEEDRTLKIHAEMLENNQYLLPGMYVEARIVAEDRKVPALPEDALTVDKGLSYIFVREEEHEGETHFKKVAVMTGASDFGYVEVTPLEEVATDGNIVIKGAYFLMAQTKKDEGGGGHHH